MNIGEKIKKLRSAKLMTQSELVGDEITRNMLSRIENGAANPSMETVRYIAGRLNVSPSYLLADEGDEMIFKKHSEIVGIKKAFMNEDYRICRDICINADSAEDDEIQMLLCECNLALGIESFRNGALRDCCEFLDEAIEGCGRTLYRTDYAVAVAGVCFKFMRLLSATLSSNIIDEAEVNIYPAMTDELCRYLILFERSAGGTQISEADISAIAKPESSYVYHMLAKRKMEIGEYADAYGYLHSIILGETAIPQPMLYFVLCDLEICCRETENFKGAYEYSKDKLELMQKLLS